MATCSAQSPMSFITYTFSLFNVIKMIRNADTPWSLVPGSRVLIIMCSVSNNQKVTALTRCTEYFNAGENTEFSGI